MKKKKRAASAVFVVVVVVVVVVLSHLSAAATHFTLVHFTRDMTVTLRLILPRTH